MITRFISILIALVLGWIAYSLLEKGAKKLHTYLPWRVHERMRLLVALNAEHNWINREELQPSDEPQDVLMMMRELRLLKRQGLIEFAESNTSRVRITPEGRIKVKKSLERNA